MNTVSGSFLFCSALSPPLLFATQSETLQPKTTGRGQPQLLFVRFPARLGVKHPIFEVLFDWCRGEGFDGWDIHCSWHAYVLPLVGTASVPCCRPRAGVQEEGKAIVLVYPLVSSGASSCTHACMRSGIYCRYGACIYRRAHWGLYYRLCCGCMTVQRVVSSDKLCNL